MPADTLAEESRSDIIQDVRLENVEKEVEALKAVAHQMGENLSALTASVETTNSLLKEFKDLMVKLAGGIVTILGGVFGVTAVM